LSGLIFFVEMLDLVKNPPDIRLRGNRERREKQTDRDNVTPGWMDRIMAPTPLAQKTGEHRFGRESCPKAFDFDNDVPQYSEGTIMIMRMNRMAFGPNNVEFRVTETQKTIAAKALEAVTLREINPEDPMIAEFARMMVVIQTGRMAGYFKRGFDWSCIVRGRNDPGRVAEEWRDLRDTVTAFHRNIDEARGEGARRIRGNRAKRVREAQRRQEEAAQRAEAKRIMRRLRWEAKKLEQQQMMH
jgi:hypothetical protein